MTRLLFVGVTALALVLAGGLHLLFITWESADSSWGEYTEEERALVGWAARQMGGNEIIFDVPTPNGYVIAATKSGAGRTTAIFAGFVAPLVLLAAPLLLGLGLRGRARTRRGSADPPAP